MKIKVTGLKEIQRDIAKLENEILVEIDKELNRISKEILADAVSRVHVLSGRLKASAYVNKIERGYSIGFSVSYAAFEEFGTGELVEVPIGYEEFASEFKAMSDRRRNGQSHPFLFPAFLNRKESIVDELEVAINKVLTRK